MSCCLKPILLKRRVLSYDVVAQLDLYFGISDRKGSI